MQRFLVQVEVALLNFGHGEASHRAMARDVAKLKDNVTRVLGLNAYTDFTDGGKYVVVGSLLLINRSPESRHEVLASHLVNRQVKTSWAELGADFVWPSTFGDDL